MHIFSFYSCETARNHMLQAVAITSIITIASGNLPRILIATCFLCFHVASILKGIKICVFYHFSLWLLVLMTMTQSKFAWCATHLIKKYYLRLFCMPLGFRMCWLNSKCQSSIFSCFPLFSVDHLYPSKKSVLQSSNRLALTWFKFSWFYCSVGSLYCSGIWWEIKPAVIHL